MTKCVICNGTGVIEKFDVKKIGEGYLAQVRKTDICLCQRRVILYPSDEQLTIELLKPENTVLKQRITALEDNNV